MRWALLATWPAWPYLLARWRDGSDEPLGVLAAGLLLWLAWPRGPASRASDRLTLGGLGLYGALVVWAPPLLSAAVAVLTVAARASQRQHGRVLPGWLGLALLSLPSLASLQFYLGYPARSACAEAARWLLGAQGFPVQREGAELVCGTRHLLVDAPCSGLGMLWMTLFFAMGLAAVRRLGWAPAVRLGMVAIGAALAANVLRLTGLFGTELLLGRPELHGSIGVTCFLLGLALVGWAAPPAAPPGVPLDSPRSRYLAPLAVLVACLGCLPGVAAPPPPFPGWPASWEGQSLQLVEEVTVAGFPGRIGRFTVGSDVLLLRWVDRPTRLLHSSLDCLRGAQGCSADFSWQGWHGREVIRDADGQQFTDVSQWFWAAWLGRSRGPWLAATRLSAPNR